MPARKKIKKTKPRKKAVEKPKIKTARVEVASVTVEESKLEVKAQDEKTKDILDAASTQSIMADNVDALKEGDSLEKTEGEAQALGSENTESDSAVEETEEAQDADKDADKIEDIEKDNEGDDNGWSFKKILIWVVMVILVLGALAASGMLVYQAGVKVGEEQTLKKVQAEKPTETPTPTAAQVSKATYTIEVLNGSGISGEAGKVRDVLEKEGYSVSDIGNANNSSFTDTIISAKPSVSSSWMDGIKTLLGKNYSVSEGDQLPDSSKTDVVVKVGNSSAK